MRNKKQNKKTHTLKYNRNSFWLINYKNKKKNKTEKRENNNNNNSSNNNNSERKQNNNSSSKTNAENKFISLRNR